MKISHHIRRLILVLCLSAQASLVHAVIINTISANGIPGGTATPAFSLDFGPSLQAINISINWQYDPNYLVFRKDLSTVDYGGNIYTLTAFIDFLIQGFGGNPIAFITEAGDSVGGNKIYDYTLFDDSAIQLVGEARFNTVFELNPATTANLVMPISVSGNLVDTDENEMPFVGQMSIQAIPEPRSLTEPQSLMLCLGGFGLLMLRRRMG